MTTCERLRPLLFRVAEGEAGPDEALSAARHLSDCTACRIRLARERRLAAMLEQGLADSLPIGEDFVRGVMDRLPAARRRRQSSRLRALRLAGLGGLLVAAAYAATHVEIGAPGDTAPATRRWAVALPDDVATPAALGRLGTALTVTADILNARVLSAMPARSVPLAGIATLLLCLGLAVPAAAATALGVASLGPGLKSPARASAGDPRG